MLFNYLLLIFLPYTISNHGGIEILYTYNKGQCELIAAKVLSEYVIKPKYECVAVWVK